MLSRGVLDRTDGEGRVYLGRRLYLFGLSHLVVHTSGTHNSMVTLPGLHADLAAAMRETIRHHIQTDFA